MFGLVWNKITGVIPIVSKDFSSCISDKIFKPCSFELNESRMAVVVQRLERAVVDNNFSLEKKSSWSQKKLCFLSEIVGRVRKTRVQFSPSAFNLFQKRLDKNLEEGIK